jgi:hypothetical protein
MTLLLTSDRALTAPLPGNPVVPASVRLSDSFTTADLPDINGRVTDSALGGTASTWIRNGQSLVGITGGKLVKPAGSGNDVYFVGHKAPSADYETGFVASAFGGVTYLEVRKQSSLSTAAADAYRCSISGNGTMGLMKRVGGASSTLIPYSIAHKAGDKIALRCKGTTISIVVNDTVAGQVVDASLTSAGWTGLGGTGDGSFTVDGFVVSDA